MSLADYSCRGRSLRGTTLALFAFLGLILLPALLPVSAHAEAKVPKLRGRVNDYAKLLDARQQGQIESALAGFEAQTTTQVVLLTMESLEGEDIEGFSIRVAEKWKIGQKGKDNGVILVVAHKDRKVRIEVGYGLEGALTDLEASRIIRHVILPAFRDGNFFAGIAGGLDGVMKATVGEFQAPKKAGAYGRSGTRKTKSLFSSILGIAVFILLISTRTGRFFLFATLLMGGRGGRGGGFGGFSGGGGGFGGGGASGGW